MASKRVSFFGSDAKRRPSCDSPLTFSFLRLQTHFCWLIFLECCYLELMEQCYCWRSSALAFSSCSSPLCLSNLFPVFDFFHFVGFVQVSTAKRTAGCSRAKARGNSASLFSFVLLHNRASNNNLNGIH